MKITESQLRKVVKEELIKYLHQEKIIDGNLEENLSKTFLGTSIAAALGILAIGATAPDSPKYELTQQIKQMTPDAQEDAVTSFIKKYSGKVSKELDFKVQQQPQINEKGEKVYIVTYGKESTNQLAVTETIAKKMKQKPSTDKATVQFLNHTDNKDIKEFLEEQIPIFIKSSPTLKKMQDDYESSMTGIILLLFISMAAAFSSMMSVKDGDDMPIRGVTSGGIPVTRRTSFQDTFKV